MREGSFGGESLREEEDDGAAAEFAGFEFESGIIDDKLAKRGAGFGGGAEGMEDEHADFADERGWEALGEGGSDHLTGGIDGEAAGRQAHHGLGGRTGKEV